VPDVALSQIAAAAGRHLVRPPSRHADAHWDLSFLKLQRSGWDIEIAGADTARVWDQRTRTWRPAAIRFEAGELHRVEGVSLRVMPLSQLADYKEGLARDVDLRDLSDLSS
jgi:hypothetical protein